MNPAKRVKREITIDVVDDDCWRVVFNVLRKKKHQLQLASTCKRLRRILFNMEHMLGYTFLIQVKKRLSFINSVNDKAEFLTDVMKPLANELKILEKQSNKVEKLVQQIEFMKKHNIGGVDKLKFEEQENNDMDDLKWVGGEGSFTIKNTKFTISHTCYVTSGHNDNRVQCSVLAADGHWLQTFAELYKTLEELQITQDQLLHIYHSLASEWMGGEDLPQWSLKDLFADTLRL